MTEEFNIPCGPVENYWCLSLYMYILVSVEDMLRHLYALEKGGRKCWNWEL
jgi:hypothetical protein